MEDQNYYRSRINKSLEYLNTHLTEEINIRKLADAAHFSVFHFQRIYKALQGETPYDTVLRLRLEKAAFLIKNGIESKINKVSTESGFTSVENFTRQFKSHFGCTPGQFKKNPSKTDSRIHQENSSDRQQIEREKWEDDNSPLLDINIESCSAIKVVMRRALFGADGSGLIEAYEELMNWFETTGTSRVDSRRFGMSVDDPDLTPGHLYRYDFAVAYEGSEALPDGLEYAEIPSSDYACVYCQGDLAVVGQTWDYLYRVWLPQSGYVPLHYPAVEEFLKGPETIGWNKFDLKCSVPIKKIQ